ncbi:copper chaperone PCu(A)C [Azoarcus sp. L1K30]|uniref:copper chaperone PCu(A)C n=1 Tax=Azoarcus sp. L1K30 TaxID=2820277 RepID=UPI001B840325|nr:copper chaperone PCu(A)C [Azoarcus sp. L1K30]MBR0564941.1 copper chaperone PCu(A)C [Azoarcus sp. L1K30]
MKVRLVASLCAALISSAAFAQVTVSEPWVRATVPQQKSTGAFMQITSPVDGKLVEAKSPAAKVVEIHEMVMEGDIMKMRAVKGVDLPAGKTVELKPGGYHVMLIDLNAQVKVGDTVPLTMVVEGKDGKRENVELNAPVRPLNNAAGGMQMHKMH